MNRSSHDPNTECTEKPQLNPALQRTLGIKTMEEYQHSLRIRRIQAAAAVPLIGIFGWVFWYFTLPPIALVIVLAAVLATIFLYLPRFIK